MVGDKEMRTMLMSLRDDVYRKVLSGVLAKPYSPYADGIACPRIAIYNDRI